MFLHEEPPYVESFGILSLDPAENSDEDLRSIPIMLF